MDYFSSMKRHNNHIPHKEADIMNQVVKNSIILFNKTLFSVRNRIGQSNSSFVFFCHFIALCNESSFKRLSFSNSIPKCCPFNIKFFTQLYKTSFFVSEEKNAIISFISCLFLQRYPPT